MNGTVSTSGSQLPQPAKTVDDPDADILLALGHGGREAHEALGQLMDRHLAGIKSAARHMLGDEMMAEDIAQEVFLRAWKQAPNWQSGQAKFSTWLHTVTKNLCYDRLRKKKEIYSDVVPDMQDDRPEAAQTLADRETHSAQKSKIERAMQALPKRQRMAITLCHYQNLPQREAAEIMEVGLRAYESLLARGRKNLRTQLEQYKSELLDG